MLHESYISHDLTKEFFKITEGNEEKKVTPMKYYYWDGEKACFTFDTAYETITQEILDFASTQWQIRDINTYRVCFVSE